MGKNKLERFEDIDRFDNVLELTDYRESSAHKPKGRWNEEIFENYNPITLELACGKGTYTVELARRNPTINYVGIDIKGSRIWKGAKEAKENKLENVRFLRMYIDHLEEYFGNEEVDEIWITFPDPYPRGSDRSKRLTSHKFLKKYKAIVKHSGCIHLKTDSTSLFEFSKKSILEFNGKLLECVDDIYTEKGDSDLLTIKTNFEKKHLDKGKAIKYLKFSFE